MPEGRRLICLRVSGYLYLSVLTSSLNSLHNLSTSHECVPSRHCPPPPPSPPLSMATMCGGGGHSRRDGSIHSLTHSPYSPTLIQRAAQYTSRSPRAFRPSNSVSCTYFFSCSSTTAQVRPLIHSHIQSYPSLAEVSSRLSSPCSCQPAYLHGRDPREWTDRIG